ncbi:MAG: MFS transporter [Desulfobacteraceae bacterium]
MHDNLKAQKESVSPGQGPGAGRRGEGDGSTFRSQLGLILFLTAIFFLNFLSRIVFAPLMPGIETDLGLAHAEAASLFLLIGVGYFVALLGSGFVSCRLTHRGTIILSALAMGGVLMGISLSSGLWTIRISLLVLGMAAGLYLPSGIATLTSVIQAQHWGKAIAIHELAPNMSFVAAPLLAEALLLWVSWRGVVLFLGICSLLVGLVFTRFGGGARFGGEAPGFISVKALLSEPSFWIMALLFSIGISATLGIYTMLPLYLVTEHGLHRNWANTLIALSRISGLFMAFFAGWASDRFGPNRTISTVFFLTGLATVFLGMVPTAWIVVIVFLQPIMAVCFFPPGFAALSAITPPSARNIAVSLTVPLAFVIGGGAIPIGIGAMGDAGSFGAGIALTGGLILLGSLLSLFLKPARS